MTARWTIIIAVMSAGLFAISCKREERGFRVSPPSAETIQLTRVGELEPGIHSEHKPVKNEYEENAQGLSEGKQLYSQMNCVGCHAHGGGGMGPPLMDSKWIYGSEPDQVFATIVQGRPNGMPSFAGKMPDYKVWQLVAYVRSISGLTDKTAATGRDDHMKGKPSENSIKSSNPRISTEPK